MKRGAAVLRFLRHEWHNALGFIGTAFIALAGLGILDSPNASVVVTFFVVGLLSTAASGVLNVVRRRKWAALERARDDANIRAQSRTKSIQQILEGMLIALAGEVGVPLGASRLSLYVHVQGGLVLISRTSEHPEWRKRGRPAYPLDQGAIGAAWTKGRSVQVDLPVDREEWNARMGDFGIPYEVAKGLRMQSLSIAALRIDTLTVMKIPVAIVVIEGAKQRTINARSLDELESSHAWKMLGIAVTQSERLPDVATEVRDTPTLIESTAGQ